MHDPTRWHVCEDAPAVATEAARRILAAAETAIAAHGVFRTVLASGRTSLQTYRLLSQAMADWTGWHLYFSDERCLPPDHDGRNSRAAALAWPERVPIPAEYPPHSRRAGGRSGRCRLSTSGERSPALRSGRAWGKTATPRASSWIRYTRPRG